MSEAPVTIRAAMTSEAERAIDVKSLLDQARRREGSLVEAFEIVRRVATDAADEGGIAKSDRGGLFSLFGVLSSRRSRPTHVALASRLEALAVRSTRLGLALERVELELTELRRWNEQLDQACAALGEEANRRQEQVVELQRQRAAADAILDAAESAVETRVQAQQQAVALTRQVSEGAARVKEAKTGARVLRRHAVAATDLAASFGKVRAQLERMKTATERDRTAMSGNVSIRSQVFRRKELAKDVNAAMGEHGTDLLARETLQYLTDALDLLRRHQTEVARDAGEDR